MRDFQAELKLEGIEVDSNFNNEINLFLEILKKWNKVHNVSRMKDNELEDSVIDSLIPLNFLKDINFNSVLDIGSGNGFPAIPIAIARKNIRVAMAEPVKKKSSFLHFAKISLNLHNAEIYSKRVEELEIGEFDIVSSRAVGESSLLLSLAEPHIKKNGGSVLLYKGSRLSHELKDISDKYSYKILSRGNRNYILFNF